MAKLDTKTVVQRFVEAHGYKYDYSKVDYVNSVDPVTVVCPIHGDFQVRSILHWKGQECLHCSGVKSDWPSYLNKFRLVHGDKYEYSKVIFEGPHKAITVVCPTHGDFDVQPVNHGRVTSGCRGCSADAKIHKSAETILEKFKQAHGETYSYEKFEYCGALRVSTITCLKHGDFYMTPGNHYQGHGCPSCWQNTPSRPEVAWMASISRISGWEYTSSPKIQGVIGVPDSIFEAGLDRPVVVEYDGNYWHSREKSMLKDTKKTQQLAETGHHVVRLRVTGQRILECVPNATLNVSVPEYPTDSLVQEIITKIKEINCSP